MVLWSEAARTHRERQHISLMLASGRGLPGGGKMGGNAGLLFTKTEATLLIWARREACATSIAGCGHLLSCFRRL